MLVWVINQSVSRPHEHMSWGVVPDDELAIGTNASSRSSAIFGDHLLYNALLWRLLWTGQGSRRAPSFLLLASRLDSKEDRGNGGASRTFHRLSKSWVCSRLRYPHSTQDPGAAVAISGRNERVCGIEGCRARQECDGLLPGVARSRTTV